MILVDDGSVSSLVLCYYRGDSVSYSKKILGLRIRRERELLKYTREQLAEQLDISTSYLGLLERGEKNPSLQTLWEIKQTFNRPLEYFLVNQGEVDQYRTNEVGREYSEAVGANELSSIEEMVSIFETMEEKELAYICKWVKDFKKYNVENG